MKNKYIAKRYWKDHTTPMGKVDELAKAYDDVINLSLGDPDLITDAAVIDAALCDAHAGHTKYTDFRGDPELRREIARFYKEEYSVSLADEEIFVTAGACVAMYLVLEAILDEGDEVVIPSPYFTPYPQQIELAGGVPVELETLYEEDFQISAERLERCLNERTRAIIINTPSNPTGRCLNDSSLEAVANGAKEHDLIVIADDIYTAFSFERPFLPIMKLGGMRVRTVTINSFSKNFTMTGWRVGNIIASPAIIDCIRQINENVVFTTPSVSQRAALHALERRHEIQPPIVEEYLRRAEYAISRINSIPWMSVNASVGGTFYLFPSIVASGLSSARASELILSRAHVLTIPGTAFGRSGEGHLRLACTVGHDKLREAFDRIEAMELSPEGR